METIQFFKEEKYLLEELFKDKNQSFKREIYPQLNKSNIIILFGLRGTGKTTLLAQKYLEVKGDRLALHGEHLNMAGYTIKDLISIQKHFFREGYLFIDEITKLKNWDEELKVFSDMYPKIRIIVTGSSAVNLQEARRTLARRAVFINLKPLTFNEFLELKHNTKIRKFNLFSKDLFTEAMKTELDARDKLKNINEIILEYKEMNIPYLLEKPTSTILDLLQRIIYEDIGGTSSFNEEVLSKFWPLLKLLALSEKISYDALANDLNVGKGTIIKMIDYLEKASVIHKAQIYKKGKSKIRKEPKVLFVSPFIRMVLLDLLGEKERAIGLSREDLFAMHTEELYYLKTGPDFVWKNTLFEIGGPNKDLKQFKEIDFKGKKIIVFEGVEIQNKDVFKLPFYIFLSHF